MAENHRGTDLDRIDPERAIEMYLKSRENEVSRQSLQNYRYDLEAFTRWFNQETDYTYLSELSGKDLMAFRLHREENVATVTARGNLWNLKKFIRFCENIDAVPPGFNEKVSVPDTKSEEEVKDSHLTEEEAEKILDYLGKYEYGSFRHAAVHTLWHTGMRSGSLRALDLKDYKPGLNVLEIRHRPDTETPLKNGKDGERDVYISDELIDTLEAFKETGRADIRDDYGRRPLFASQDTRVGKTTLQRNIYTATRPCHYGQECPHDRDLDKCEATTYNTASKCPSSVSPHPLRRGAITALLNTNEPEAKAIASERMNVTTEVLDKHYNEQSLKEQMETRKQFLEGID
jgi:integrase